MGVVLRVPVKFEKFGAVSFYDVSEVVGMYGLGLKGRGGVFSLNTHGLEEYASKTAIVVPVKDEDLSVFEGVIKAVPLASPLIIVSASSTSPIDVYEREVELAKLLNTLTGRRVVVVHQRDKAWVEALADTSLEDLVDSGGVRLGKGEGMILGVLVASWLKASYVGFIDSDNYIPGAVNEYAMSYYTGLAMASSRYSMVRVVWHYKGKLPTEDVIFRKRGRVSVNTNTVLNYALSSYRKIETEIVKSANSGEHAMSLELALKMPWAGRFAIETFELATLLESCYVGLELGFGECNFLPEGVKILQVETRNPHIHAEKGDTHLAQMAAESLGTIYYSALASDDVKVFIRRILIENYFYEDEPPTPLVYRLDNVDPHKVVSKYLAESRLALDAG